MGQGRTTTGITVATILHQSICGQLSVGLLSTQRPRSLRITALSKLVQTGGDRGDEKENLYLKGEYTVIRDLVRVISGASAKSRLDRAIDLCAIVTNLRESIYEAHLRCETKPHYSIVAVNFLERYCYLLAFTGYVEEEVKKENCLQFDQTFENWIKSRPEVVFIFENISILIIFLLIFILVEL